MRILHLEDNQRDAQHMKDILSTTWPDCGVTVVDSREDYLRELRSGRFDIVVSDYKMPGFSGLEALTLVREYAPDVPFIFFSGTIGEERAIDAVRAGAADYVLKDRMQRLPIAIERVVRETEAARARRRAEDNLAKERYLTEILMENLPDSVFFKDDESRYISVSRSHARSHGRSVSEMIGLTNFELFDCTFAEETRADELEIMRTGLPMLDKEERVVWPDGRVTWSLTTKLPLRDKNGRIAGTFGIARDITEQRSIQQRNREQAEIIDHAPIAIAICDLDQRITYCNAGFTRLFEMRRDELIGRTSAEILEGEALEKLGHGWATAIEDGDWSGEVTIATRSGRVVECEVRRWRVTDRGGVPTGCLTMAIDITERKKLESQFLRSQRLEAIGTLAGGVAHDLNNVLAPIMMGVEMLRDELPDRREVFETILASANRGSDLVKLLLAYAKGSEGVRVPVSPERILKDLAQIMKGSFPKNIRLTVKCDPDLPSVLGDATQLHQVLLNLCVNARDAMPDGGSLVLEATQTEVDEEAASGIPDLKPGRHVVLRVADSGTGIPAEIMDRILDPFFTTKGPLKGTGLGLSTVVGILKGHGGALHLQSKVGAGSTFTVFVPVLAGNREIAATDELEGELCGNGETVLFVDDETAVRDVARAVMSRLNYVPLTATDGSDGLVQALLNRDKLAAILADVHMPRLDGVTFVKMIRRMLPDTPVMIVSGRLDDAEKIAFAELGINARLTKPFTGQQLARAMRQLLKRQ